MPITHIILGAGGAGRTIAGACHHLDNELGFLDDHVTVPEVNGIPVLGTLAARTNYRDAFCIIGFGSRESSRASRSFPSNVCRWFSLFQCHCTGRIRGS